MALAFLDDVFKSTFSFYNKTYMSAVLYGRVSEHSICTDELTYILWVLNPKDHNIPKPENNMPSYIAHVKWLLGCEERKDVGTPKAVRERVADGWLMPEAELVLIEAYLAGITIGCNEKVYTDENGPPLIGELMRFYGKERGMDNREVKFLKPDIITKKLIAKYCLKEKLGKKTAEFFYRFIGL